MYVDRHTVCCSNHYTVPCMLIDIQCVVRIIIQYHVSWSTYSVLFESLYSTMYVDRHTVCCSNHYTVPCTLIDIVCCSNHHTVQYKLIDIQCVVRIIIQYHVSWSTYSVLFESLYSTTYVDRHTVFCLNHYTVPCMLFDIQCVVRIIISCKLIDILYANWDIFINQQKHWWISTIILMHLWI